MIDRKLADKLYYPAYYESHRELVLSYAQRYREKHKDELNLKCSEYRKKHYYAGCDKYDASQRRQYKTTINGKASKLASGCNLSDMRHLGIESSITKEWVLKHILQSKCIFCGDNQWEHLKCGRIDENQPHTPENTICICAECSLTQQTK